MAIKSTLNTIEKKIDYPVLKLIKDLGEVVLFTSYGTGTVVKSNGYNKLGEHSVKWAENECFEIFIGNIALENE